MSRKNTSKLSKQFTQYISKKQIFSVYREIADLWKDPDELGYLNSDLLKLMGYTIDMDNQDMHLFRTIDQKMYNKHELDKKRITSLLQEIPLYYVLSLLGYAHYKKNILYQESMV